MQQSIQQKRLLQEVKHLNQNPSEEYKAGPLENDMHIWHFTIRGPVDTEFEDGVYHGYIQFPFDFPLSPPNIYFLSKNGRFETNTKICLSITQFHADQWNASWTVRSMLEALISMFPEKEKTLSVGSLNYTEDMRKKLAKKSWEYECEKCGPMKNILKQRIKVQKESLQNKSEEASKKESFQRDSQKEAQDQELIDQNKKQLEQIEQIIKNQMANNLKQQTQEKQQMQNNSIQEQNEELKLPEINEKFNFKQSINIILFILLKIIINQKINSSKFLK